MNIHNFTTELNATFMLSVGAFLLAMVLTPLYTYFAYRYKFWKKQRVTSSLGEKLEIFTKLHANKFTRAVPTMAGIVGITSIGVVTYFFNFDRAQTWLPLAALLGGGVVGLLDDIINIRGTGKGVAGLRSSLKFAMIIAMSLVLGWFFYAKLGYTSVHISFMGDIALGAWIIPLFVLAVVSTSNAVNISDGLDGLAGGLLSIAYGVFGIIALLQGHLMIAGFCFTAVGALLSYLWFNIYPMRFMMGDVGSFAFGTSLGVIAMLTNTIALLPVIGIIFVIEAGSSLLQMTSKKFFNKKIFISAPIHHHLEAQGWPEVKVTMRFWVIGCVAGFIGLLMALAGGHI
ncbi:MAG: hypothetical protein WAQ25_01730 [Candidatus Saccharimonas sp.]